MRTVFQKLAMQGWNTCQKLALPSNQTSGKLQASFLVSISKTWHTLSLASLWQTYTKWPLESFSGKFMEHFKNTFETYLTSHTLRKLAWQAYWSIYLLRVNFNITRYDLNYSAITSCLFIFQTFVTCLYWTLYNSFSFSYRVNLWYFWHSWIRHRLSKKSVVRTNNQWL